MIPIKENRELVSSGADESIAFGISAKDSIHIMSILRDQLYSDKIMAVLREIGANAQDANAMVDRRDVPIEVTLPTLADPTLRIRDHGPGLSLDDVRTVFSQYGASTKRDSNEAIGMLGIGSKSPFAYSDSFVVTSWHGGSKAIYNAVIDPSGAGQIDLLDVSDCDEAVTGVEVSLGIRPADCKAFEDRAKQLYVHFVPRPKINVELPAPPKTRAVTNGLIDDSDDSYGYNGGKWVAVMGCIPYVIDLNQLSSGTGGANLTTASRKLSGTLTFGIGELQVAASRESLKYGDSTRAVLIERINEAVREYVKTMLEGIDSLSNWEKRLRVTAVTRRQLPVPAGLKVYADGNVSLKLKDTLSTLKPSDVVGVVGRTFGFQTRNYNGRMQPNHYIQVGRETRIVIWDERKAIAGYALKGHDYVVRPTAENEGRLPAVIKDLNALLVELLIDGVETVRLSSIPWTRPESKRPVVPRDKERAKARAFVLDMHLVVGTTGPATSQLWTPKDVTPRSTDVFAVLEGYKVPDFDSFYEAVKEDSALFKSLGLTFPQIIGYKSTKAKPVTSSNCAGLEYRRWRATDMPKLLMTNEGVLQAVLAMSYVRHGDHNFDGWFHGSINPMWVEDELGTDHPLVRFADAEKRSRMIINSASTQAKVAAQYVRNSRTTSNLLAKGDADRKALTDRYPLLAAAPAGALAGSNRKLWVDYVRMVDSLEAKQGNQEAA